MGAIQACFRGGNQEIQVKDSAARMRELRDRMRAQGYVLRQVWVHPKDWERVQTYLRRVNKRREA